MRFDVRPEKFSCRLFAEIGQKRLSNISIDLFATKVERKERRGGVVRYFFHISSAGFISDGNGDL